MREPKHWANWSPDGKTRCHFTSARDGHTCFWGQRIENASSHQPVPEMRFPSSIFTAGVTYPSREAGLPLPVQIAMRSCRKTQATSG